MNTKKLFYFIALCLSINSHGMSMKEIIYTFENVSIRPKSHDDKKSKLLLNECKKANPSIDTITLLLNAKADQNVKNKKNNTQLYLCLKGENQPTKIVQLLLNSNAEPNIVNHRGCGPLHALYFANKIYSLEVTKILLETKANPNISNHFNKYTPLHLVCRERIVNLDIVKELIAYKADPNHEDEACNSPFDVICCIYENVETINFFLEHKANIARRLLFELCEYLCIPLKTFKLFFISCIHQTKHKMQSTIKKIFSQSPPFKKMVFTVLLCLKRKKLKIPKFVIFKIIEPYAALEFIHININQKTENNQTLLEKAKKYSDFKGKDVIAFFEQLEVALEKGLDDVEELLKL